MNQAVSLLCAAALNSVLIGIPIAALVWLILRIVPRGALNAATRYAIWWACLAVVAALPATYRLPRISLARDVAAPGAWVSPPRHEPASMEPDATQLSVSMEPVSQISSASRFSLLRFPIDFDYVHASRYGSATRGAGIEWRVSPSGLAKGRHVLVLDDILDHGETMAAIRDRLLELGALSVQCAVLVEKKLEIAKPIHADFVGLSIPDRFVFGCGMDAKGYWRNLPEIRAMKNA